MVQQAKHEVWEEKVGAIRVAICENSTWTPLHGCLSARMVQKELYCKGCQRSNGEATMTELYLKMTKALREDSHISTLMYRMLA